MDRMDDVPDATARNRFIGIYLDFYPNLAKVEARVRIPLGLPGVTDKR